MLDINKKTYKVIKIILQIIPLVSFLVIYDSSLYSDFGELSWKILILLLFVRPVSDIFPKIKILSKIVSLRKELGIIVGIFAIAHVFGYFYDRGIPVNFVFDSIMWDIRGYLGWGMYGFIVSFILLITSNNYSIKLFKKYWKPIQRLSYLMLFFVAIHAAMATNEYFEYISIVLIYIVVYLIAYFKKK